MAAFLTFAGFAVTLHTTTMTAKPDSLPPEAWAPLVRMARLARRPLERFLRIEAASGIVLLAATVLALGLANSPFAESYFALWHTPVGVQIGAHTFTRTLEWLVNDGLMVIFFFVVGMEIRREIDHGELSDLRRAALPAAAALGGMVVPACVYVLLADRQALAGWGVPMATDIAFALGVLALLGRRVPPALRVLLLALAVIDDLGAIIVIAVFYSGGVQWLGLGVAAAAVTAILVMQRTGVRNRSVYVIPGVVTWAGVYVAGIHPTIAGVILGLLTPVRAWLGADGFVTEVRRDLEQLTGAPKINPHDLAATLNHVNAVRLEALSPAEQLIEALHPWIAFGVMPIFAFANAGVALDVSGIGPESMTVIRGAALGLLLGKPAGVLFACVVMLKLRIATLPRGLSVSHLVVLGAVAGVGFTMSLFIAGLAFPEPHFLSAAKLGVLGASVAAGVAALVLGRLLLTLEVHAGAATSADEAESSTEQ